MNIRPLCPILPILRGPLISRARDLTVYVIETDEITDVDVWGALTAASLPVTSHTVTGAGEVTEHTQQQSNIELQNREALINGFSSF